MRAAAKAEAAEKCEQQEAMGEGKEGAVPLAPEMVEGTSREEELEEGVGAGLLLRPLREAPAPPISRACPGVLKKIKMQQPWVPQGEERLRLQIVEHSMHCSYAQA